MATSTGSEDLRPHVREEEPRSDDVVVVRGGPGTLAKLAAHARRTHRAFSLDGAPFWGVSVFCALDEIGPASLDTILVVKMANYASSTLRPWGASATLDSSCFPRSDVRTTPSAS
jgi:hypothetical protein